MDLTIFYHPDIVVIDMNAVLIRQNNQLLLGLLLNLLNKRAGSCVF